ncbi:hypothetical protein ES708_19155 [subsurface metagenome]
MAIVTGGLHGRPRGNVDGIIYGSARTRTGKVVTAREFVIPTNPDTPLQRIQRRKFSASLFAVRHLTSSLWKEDFNRAIGQLPGFQSMMSIVLLNTDDTFMFNTPPDVPLGNLHFPATFDVTPNILVGGGISYDWSDEVGLNGTAADVLVVFGIVKEETAEGERLAINFIETATRADTTLDVDTTQISTLWQAAAYFQGAGVAEGLLSFCRFTEVESAAEPG